MYQQKVALEQVSSDPDWQNRVPNGRWIGLLRVRGDSRSQVLAALEKLKLQPGFEAMGLPDLINQLIADQNAPQVQYITGHWMDINNMEDLQRASEFAQGQRS
jgi:phosphoenolpyruvate phosphomutase